MPNSISKVVVLSSSYAEHIGDTDKMKIVINAAVVDIEDNFLPLEAMDIYVNNKLVDTTTSDTSGELTMTLQLDYNADTEMIVQAEHKASGQKSLKKLLPIKGQSIPVQVSHEEKITATPSPTSKLAAISAVRKDGLLLGNIKYAHLVDDNEVVREAVKQNGLALEFASRRLRKKKQIVIIAVENNGMALQFTSVKKKDDIDIVLKAVENNGDAVIHASENLKNNREIAKAAIYSNPFAISGISESLRQDPELEKLSCRLMNLK